MHDDQIRSGLEHGFVQKDSEALSEFSPQFVFNDPRNERKVLTTLIQEMRDCDEFMLSVAFVNDKGVGALIGALTDLNERKARGRIIVSTYQNFTEPRALERLRLFDNIELKAVTWAQGTMHSKCYIFRKKDVTDVIIGSSNLTGGALSTNIEWNLKISTRESGDVVSAMVDEFNQTFDIAVPVDDGFIEEYSKVYREQSRKRKALEPPPLSGEMLVPNPMQEQGLESLKRVHDSGAPRALVVSATGTGKTYLAAFDARRYREEHPGARFLYLVHRNRVLKQSKASFERVMGNVRTSIFSTMDPDTRKAEFIFATIQSISQDDVLKTFPRDSFDYIILDETHHAGADTYQKVIDHFTPTFLLGMTATPDTTEYDIYKIFNYNIAFNIRLKQALDAGLICPLHYYGISWLNIAGNDREKMKDFNRICLKDRVRHVMEKAEFYGYSGERVKGIGFCPKVEDAYQYAAEFRKNKLKAVAVEGKTDKKDLERYIGMLEADSGETLDYIFTADLFNEGVDIPAVNQVLMLRPTKSPVIFIQQIGRGLRLHEGKDYLVILDFIGNYDNSYNIAIALSDDYTYRKKILRKLVESGDSIIPGESTVEFDRVSREKILDSIDKSNFGIMKILREEYNHLKALLGRVPELRDFVENGSVDPLNILKEHDTYQNFLTIVDKENSGTLTPFENSVLKQATRIAASGKRVLEVILMEGLLKGEHPASFLRAEIKKRGIKANEEDIQSAIRVANGSFFFKKEKQFDLVGRSGDHIPPKVSEALRNDILRDHVRQIVELGYINWENEYQFAKNGFVLHGIYTREDIGRILDWQKMKDDQFIGGYTYDEGTNTMPVFVTYDKGKKRGTIYNDHFKDKKTLIAESKNRRLKNSLEMKILNDSESNGVRVELFMQRSEIKTKRGGQEFYYLGKVRFGGFQGEVEEGDRKTILIQYNLENEVPEDLFKYLTTPVSGEPGKD
ncbi:MAG: DUF3427 domain-containing protein [Thermoplasmata archaeon]|nr:DUF3427 domain-containing protein [Thermoplasmata archaeon]